MKLDGTAARRVKGSVKYAKPAQHCCGRARGDELWEEKWDRCRWRNWAVTLVKGDGRDRAGDGQMAQAGARSEMEEMWLQEVHVCTSSRGRCQAAVYEVDLD